MSADNKKLVQAITSQEENFAQWYTDICLKAEIICVANWVIKCFPGRLYAPTFCPPSSNFSIKVCPFCYNSVDLQ